MSEILRLREDLKITQQELADQVGLDRTLISRAENGKLSIRTAKKIAHVLNVDWKIFFDEKRVENARTT